MININKSKKEKDKALLILGIVLFFMAFFSVISMDEPSWDDVMEKSEEQRMENIYTGQLKFE